jgi:hypothetical protein
MERVVIVVVCDIFPMSHVSTENFKSSFLGRSDWHNVKIPLCKI